MSQHWFPATLANGLNVMVLAGYDRPLEGYFLVVQLKDGDDEFVYSNLDDPALAGSLGFSSDFEYFERRLSELGAKVPDSVAAAVRDDCHRRIGNRHVEYDEAGVEIGG